MVNLLKYILSKKPDETEYTQAQLDNFVPGSPAEKKLMRKLDLQLVSLSFRRHAF
jgi:hypothetical protein